MGAGRVTCVSCDQGMSRVIRKLGYQMLRNLAELFAKLSPEALKAEGSDYTHSIQLAIAVLLVEVMRADSAHCSVERSTLRDVLRQRFELAPDELERLIELAELRSTEAHDLHSFTAVLNQSFNENERQNIFEELWQVAYADGRLDAHENHLMRRLADLLHIRHAAFVGTKIKASQRDTP